MADELYIESNKEEQIIVSGDIGKLLSSKRVLRMLKDYMQYECCDDKIVIQAEGNLTLCLDRLIKLSNIAGCTIHYSDNVSDAVTDYKVEENKFAEFSKNALDIRNNNCDTSSFIRFKESLEKNMSSRILYNLQMLSAYHLAFSQNACNFSVPGAGKTSVVYGAYTYLKNLAEDDVKKVNCILIIGPLSSFGPWELEYKECYGKEPTCKRLVGSISLDEKKQYLYNENISEITLLSYASVASLRDELKFFLEHNKVMVVLDEAHKIKNTNGGITAQSVLELSANSCSRVVLTGTPAPNGYEDLSNLFKFIWPTRKIIKFQSGQLRDMSKNVDDVRVTDLLEAIAPYFVRVKKSDLGIPEAINNPPIIVPMNPGQRKIYDYIENKYIHDIADSRDQKFKNELVRARLVRLMQAATNPELLQQPLKEFAIAEGIDLSSVAEDTKVINEVMKYGDNESPAKFEAAKILIEEIISKNEKVIVWACYIKTIESFQKYLLKNDINSKVLYGGTPIATDGMTEEDEEYEFTREAIIKQFHESDSEFKVIIANPFAVAESISLHKVCHNAIYIERSFNAAHFIQSKDRIHRYGLKDGTITNYYYLISENSIDEVIQDRLSIKERRLIDLIESMPIPLFDNVFVEGGDEDIKAVLTDYARRAKKM